MAAVGAVLVGALLVPALVAPRGPDAAADTLTMSADATRSSWYPDEAALAPSTVADSHFGRLFTTSVDGQVYAQPLVSQGTLLAVTENDSAYGIDPVTGTVKWTHHYGRAWDPSVIDCGDLSPKVGISATPVVDPATDIAYFTAKVATAADSSTSAWYLHAVNVATGVEQPNFPVLVHGHATNDPRTTFHAQYELQRTGIALVNGVVYLGFGAHCDYPPYLGWVVGVSTAGSITSMWADETGQNSNGGAGIWQSGAAPIVDTSGHLFFVTGNGTPPPPGPALGQSQPQGLGECAIALDTATGGTNGAISASDWFCPSNAGQLNGYDGDFGSGGPAELPAGFETAKDDFPMMVVAGKSGEVYLLDMNDLGGEAQGVGGTDRVVAEVGPFGGVWSKPAVWPGNGGYVYIPTASPGASGGGSSGSLNVFQRVVDGSGDVSLGLVATAPGAFGFSSSSPVVTSDATTPGSAVVWIVHADDASGVGATLRAYEALPQDGSLQLLFSAALGSPGTGAKFNPPAVDAGRVYVGTRDATIVAFGSGSGTPPVRADAVDFAPTSLGSSSAASATFTATAPVTINSISVENGAGAQQPVYAAGDPSPALPATFGAGQQLTVPLTFTPAALGVQTGMLTVNTSAGPVSAPLAGTGLSPTVPIGSSPAALDFGTLPIGGAPATSTETFTNNGSSPFTVTGLTDPGGPFTVTNAPATDGSVTVDPHDTIGLDVTFTPPATSGDFVQTFTGQLTLQTDVGSVLVPVTGRAAPPAQITISPTRLDFGTVALGQSVTESFTVGNAGGTPLAILKSKPPAANAFTAVTALPEGTVIAPGAHVIVSVRFRPGALGAAHDQWVINGNDDTGPQTVTFTGTGARLNAVPPPTAGGWQLNGAARLIGAALQLTPASTSQRGSAFWPHALASARLHVSFDETTGGGTGADGLTLAFADAARAGPSALGGTGSLLGFGGIPGAAVAMATYPSAANPAVNSIGLVTGLSGSGLTWTTVDAAIPSLRSGPHLVTVDVSGGVVSVTVDGLAAFHAAVKLPPRVYLGFTGGTGGVTDAHAVSSVQISTTPVVPPPPPAPRPPTPRASYRLVGSDGGVFTFGGAQFYGSTGAIRLNRPTVGIASDPQTGGYWLVASDGGVFAFHAPFFGSTGAIHLNQPIVGMTATPDGRGYWMVARDGGVFAFGDARFRGSMGGTALRKPIVGMAADGVTGGYWLVGSDGGVFSFAAGYFGSAGALRLADSIVEISATPHGRGYRLVGADGSLLEYGDATGYGSVTGSALPSRVVGIAPTANGGGYWQTTADGSVFGFGDAPFLGSVEALALTRPVVGIAG